MSYLPPVDRLACPPAAVVKDLDGAAPGSVEFYDHHEDRGLPAIKDAGLLVNCPCGCGVHIVLPFKRRILAERPTWAWDGNRERPSITPSLLIHQINDKGHIVGEHWHGFLTAGQWKSCR